MSEKEDNGKDLTVLRAYPALVQFQSRVIEAGEEGEINLNPMEREAIISAVNEIDSEIEAAQTYSEVAEASLMDSFAASAIPALISQGIKPEAIGDLVYRYALSVIIKRKAITEGKLEQRLKEVREKREQDAAGS